MRNTIIKDPVLEPFHLSKDQYCYTVIETITPDAKNIGKFGKKDNGNQGKDYEKPLGYYTSLAAALKSIAKFKLHSEKEYSSVLSYIKEWEYQQEEIKKLLSKLELI
tara:strand:- start:1298 stop:1618 length:321 start_codon:yes stop_codon:yes gene_type:complete